MSNIKWCYLIVDEAHTLKNSKGRLFESLNAFSTKHRLLLTGTPLQNNLNELWSLLNFILPSIFDSAQSFESWFCSPFQHLHKKKDKSIDIRMSDSERLLVMDRLHRAIDPFLLRRMKKDVLPDMVKKEEIVIKIPISGMQLAMYKQLQKYGALRYKTDTKRYNFNNIMMQLRKCANHPYLFAPDEYNITDNIYKCSGKFVLLRHLIPKMKKFNHRMLIFCQFVQTMDILSEFFEYINEEYLRIDGSTDSDDRIDYISQFNSTQIDKYSIFLLSTRACGLGLNLYSADTVILFDSDWNPQQDIQAQARCHRIGQKKAVFVYRLVTKNTYEAQMFERASKKLGLGQAILKSVEHGVKKKDVKDLKQLDNMLRHGAYAILNDDDEATKKWQECDIDELLQQSSHRITDNKNGNQQEKGIGMHSFTRKTFESGGAEATANLDVTGENFWNDLWKIKKQSNKNKNKNDDNDENLYLDNYLLDDKTRADRLLTSLTSMKDVANELIIAKKLERQNNNNDSDNYDSDIIDDDLEEEKIFV
eukprot:365224_1